MQWGTWLTILYPFPVMPILGKTSKAYALSIFSIIKVQRVADKLGLNVEVHNIENPRMELEEHYYNPDHQNLIDLGYKPTHDIEAEMEIMLNDLMKYKHRIEARVHALIPDIRWDGSKRKASYL